MIIIMMVLSQLSTKRWSSHSSELGCIQRALSGCGSWGTGTKAQPQASIRLAPPTLQSEVSCVPWRCDAGCRCLIRSSTGVVNPLVNAVMTLHAPCGGRQARPSLRPAQGVLVQAALLAQQAERRGMLGGVSRGPHVGVAPCGGALRCSPSHVLASAVAIHTVSSTTARGLGSNEGSWSR